MEKLQIILTVLVAMTRFVCSMQMAQCIYVIVLVANVMLLEALLLPHGIALRRASSIDLRSDTLTKPSPAMRKAMFEAEVGDDVYCEDPTVHKLELRAAKMFGKESSLFFPTGTMANLAASMAWCNNRGSEVIIGDQSHMFTYEQANLAQIAGISPRVIPTSLDGSLVTDKIEHAIRESNIHYPVTELIALENTHNICGGRVLPDGYLESVGVLAKRAGIPLHIDGARIWNAATATHSSVAKLAQPADSISACLSKGLGAPAGSLLVGPGAFIAKARRIRKALGGGMRQVGILAAAGLQALDDFESGILSADHEKASKIAHGLSEIAGLRVDAVDTNIVLVHLSDHKPADFAAKLQEYGVHVLPHGSRTLRVVTHRDITEEDVPVVVAAFREVAAKVWGASGSAALVVPALVMANLADKVSSGEVNLSTSTQKSIAEAPETPQPIESKNIANVPVAVVPPITPPMIIPEPIHVVTPTVASVTPAVQQVHRDGDIASHFEEVSVRGMSVSPDGFCVILQGLVSNRCVRVLVTPEDPMSDGLDHDEVESSEAVTLLQLLQGIDVESFLEKDALATKLPSTGPPGARVKYDLKAVLLNGVGRGWFEAVLAGSPKLRNGEKSTKGSNGEGRAEALHTDGASVEHSTPQLSSTDSVSAVTSDASSHASHQLNTTLSGYEREVIVDSPFYAIALALRYRVPIEVRSDLLQNEKISFPEQEIAVNYPKLLAASVKAPAPLVNDRSHLAERLKKRLTEALRQRNQEKIAQIQEQIAALNAVSAASVPTPTSAAGPDNTTQSVHAVREVSVDSAHTSNSSHETSPIQ